MVTNKLPQKYLFFLILLCLGACVKSRKPDVSHIDVKVKINRFDKDFANEKITDLEILDQNLSQKYGDFYQDYMTKIIGNPSIPRTQILAQVRHVDDFKSLNAEVQKTFPSMEDYENGLTQSFKYLKYYYPKSQVPDFYTFISGFDIQLPIGNRYMGIGLDMFLGGNNPYYKKITKSIPQYISRRFSPSYIVPRVMEGIIREDILPEQNENLNSMLDYMVYNGKLTYLLQAILPENTPDSLLFGYTPDQLEWAKSYEKDVWSFFINHKILFESDFLKFKKYINETPFTTGMGVGRESAPKLGVYIGYQIVKKYIDSHPKDSLAILLNEKNAQKVLNESKYKP